jgi:transposase
MLFPPSALERAMKVREVILRAISGEYTWVQASEILGMSPRSVRRWRLRMERNGYAGLIDMRRGYPSPRRAPVEEVRRILALYSGKYRGYNARHFYQTIKREHGVELSYSFVKQLLQGAGLMKKGRARGRHRMKRERKSCFGEMLHLDGSLHAWLALVPEERQTLIQVIDDATSQVLYAQLWPGETSRGVMTAIREVVQEYGIPQSLYTDRAGWAFETPRAGAKVDKVHLTQVGEALSRLGIEHIPSYSPQARGRSERMNRTVQGRLVNELRVAGVKTLEAANAYLRERYLHTHNEEFGREPADPTSAFVDLGDVDLEEVFFEEDVRKVAKDNTVSFEGQRLQVMKQKGRRSCAGLAVKVRRHLDGHYTIRRGTQLFGVYEADGRPRVAPATTPIRGNGARAPRPRGTSSRLAASGRLRLPPAARRPSRTVAKT